jgi:hypothetical protein
MWLGLEVPTAHEIMCMHEVYTCDVGSRLLRTREMVVKCPRKRQPIDTQYLVAHTHYPTFRRFIGR